MLDPWAKQCHAMPKLPAKFYEQVPEQARKFKKYIQEIAKIAVTFLCFVLTLKLNCIHRCRVPISQDCCYRIKFREHEGVNIIYIAILSIQISSWILSACRHFTKPNLRSATLPRYTGAVCVLLGAFLKTAWIWISQQTVIAKSSWSLCRRQYLHCKMEECIT